MKKVNIKKGDKVRVVAGVSKGKEGVVLKVMPSVSRVIIEGDDIRKDSKHTKPNATNQEGGIIKQDAAIHISNVMLVDSEGKTRRVGRRQEDGKSVRYFKNKSKELVK